MGRRWAILPLIMIIGSIIGPQILSSTGSGDPASEDPLIIDGEQDLMDSGYLQGGSGTETDPYILGDIPSNISRIEVRNISKWVEIRDQEIDLDSDGYPLRISNVRWCVLQNVTVIDDNHLLEVLNRTNLTIRDSTFTCTNADNSGSMYPIRVETFENTTISNSTFGINNIHSGTHYHFLQSDNLWIRNTTFDRATIWADVRFSKRNLKVFGCTFRNGSIMRPWSLYGPLDQTIDDCLFNNSILDLRGAYCYQIRENIFQGEGSAIYLGFEPEIWLPAEYNFIINNIFERSKGILIFNTWHGTFGVKKMMISGNYFGNCTGKAIDFTHTCVLDFIYIWKNIFYHNGGTGDEYNGVPQADTNWGFFNMTGNTYQFDRDGMGNFWQDWRGPDENGDGFVDEEYLIKLGYDQLHTNITDRFPVTNRFFDIERPGIIITEPEGPLSDHDSEYVKVRWEAWDNLSGLESVHFSCDGENWTNVTGFDWWPVKLLEGEQEIFMKAFDRAGLFNITSLLIDVGEIKGPVSIVSPENGEILLSSRVSIQWFVDDYFPLMNQSLLLDGKEIEIEKEDRDIELILEDGDHSLSMTFSDTLRTNLTRGIDFIVDTKPPDLVINNPGEGKVLSNRIMKFNWSGGDVNGLASVMYRIDGEVWNNIVGKVFWEFSQLMDEGNHTFEVRMIDIAGRISHEMVNFTIGDGTLVIVHPLDGYVTNVEKQKVDWTIDEKFRPINIELEHLEGGLIIDVTDSGNRSSIDLVEGLNRIKLTASDIYDNYVSDSVEVFFDSKKPFIRIENDREFVNDDPLKIEWSVLENNALDGFEYSLDGGERIPLGLNRNVSLSGLSEGPHNFQLFCTDLAGNTAMDEYDFIHDITAPEVRFETGSDPSIFLESRVTIPWSASDDNGITGSVFSTGEYRIELMGSIREWEGVLDDDSHMVKIEVLDPAGNMGSSSMEVIVDTADPEIRWLEPIINVNALDPVPFRFEALDENGIPKLEILEGNSVLWTGSGTGEKEIFLEMVEGSHELILRAEDSPGRTSLLERNIIVDRTDPVIESIDEEYKNGVLALKWKTSDEHSSVRSVSLTVGDVQKTFQEAEYSWSLDDLDPGEVLIIINVTDEAGNHAVRSFEYEIPGSPGSGVGAKDSLVPLILLFIGVIVAALIAGGVLYYLRIRDEKEEEDEKREKFVLDTRVNLPSREETIERLKESGYRPPPRLGPVKDFNDDIDQKMD
jgi:hypothetical protein